MQEEMVEVFLLGKQYTVPAELTIMDAMEYAAQTDRLVLVSGDGDFDLLVQRVRDLYNITVDVFGVPELTAFSLIRAASSFTAIEGDWLLKKR